jgi:hypothetical protein
VHHGLAFTARLGSGAEGPTLPRFWPSPMGWPAGAGENQFFGTLTQTIGDGTADFSMPPVRRGRGQGLGHTGGAWNSIWSPVEEESHPTWLIMAAQLRPEGGAAEGSMRRRFTRLEMSVRCSRWGGSPRMHRHGRRWTGAACPR